MSTKPDQVHGSRRSRACQPDDWPVSLDGRTSVLRWDSSPQRVAELFDTAPRLDAELEGSE